MRSDESRSVAGMEEAGEGKQKSSRETEKGKPDKQAGKQASGWASK